ncbi:hypothetical protein HK104_010809 [Borealophlyctis nickersoniae]|nr:hypothetical protein HK104_010809 [Borealophlyctis nickersoniae]
MGKKSKVLPPDSPLWENQTPFRILERSWKRKNLPPDLFKSLLDPSNPEQNENNGDASGLIPISLPVDLQALCSHFGQRESASPAKSTSAFLVASIPGLILIPNPFEAKAQRTVVRRCLREYTGRPNVTNLDTHFILPDGGVWRVYEESKRAEAEGDTMLLARNHNESQKPPAADEGYDETPADASTTTQVKIDPPTSPTPYISQPITAKEGTYRLRWTSLGFQYNWSTKEYHLDRRPPFPSLIANLSHAVVEAVQGITGYTVDRWKAEAGIVNFYQLKDSLMAHQDRSEINTEAPLVSFSFGNSGIFLIGTTSRDDAPTGIILRSGDVLVMSGPARKAFHGVPRILENSLPDYLAKDPEGDPSRDSDWDLFSDYLSTARINVNVRQVF